ncbi:MAG: hypothetical protein HY822_24655 [Acidobacteria bacterium]|nr:hypothetical protein [Acidobacteriota bacterium]
MRIAAGAFFLCLLFLPAGGQNQDNSQLYYSIQSLQSEVRTLQSRVQQLEVRQPDLRNSDDLRLQLRSLEERIGQLERRAPPPNAPEREGKKQEGLGRE